MTDFSPPGGSPSDDQSEGAAGAPSATPGWYPDPWEPGSQRWWDGNTWTANTARSTPGQPGTEPGQEGSAGQPNNASSTGLSEVSEWIGTVFRTAVSRAGHILPIMMVTVLPSAFATGFLAWMSVRDARINNLGCLLFDDNPEAGCATISGTSTNFLAALALAGLWWLLAIAVFHLATAHQLHGALDDHRPSWSSSLKVGVRSLPRFLLYAIGTLVVIAVAYGVSMAVGASAGPAGAALVLLLWLPLTVFLWVKLSFFPVAAAVAPPGTNLLSASSNVSDGRFMSVLGRLLLLVLLSIAVFLGSQAFSFPISLVVGPGMNEGLAEDILDEARSPDSFAIIDLVTKPAALAISLVLINVITSSIVTALQAAGAAALYRETGGPRRAGPTPADPIPEPSL